MEQMGLFLVGFILMRLGHTNMKGDISSIHWYNRTKVRREDYSKYGHIVGLGSVVAGAALVIAGLFSLLFDSELSVLVIVPGLAVGLALILYAQFKYNKGIF